jgi:hypothetical protein
VGDRSANVINNRLADVNFHITDNAVSGVDYVMETTGDLKMQLLAVKVCFVEERTKPMPRWNIPTRD